MKTRIVKLIFILLVLVYFISAKGYIASSDSVFSLRTAKSIVEKGSLKINALEGEKDFCFRNSLGEVYSKYGVGLPLLWIPYVFLGKIISLFPGIQDVSIMDFLVSFSNIFFGAGACAIMFALLKLFQTSDRRAVIAVLCLGLLTFCWRYSVWELSEAPQMFFLLLSIYGVVKSTYKSVLTGSFAFGFLLLLKIVNLIFLPLFILYLFLKNLREGKIDFRPAFKFMIFPVLGMIFLFFLNYLRFGNIFESGYGQEAGMFYPERIIVNSLRLLFSPDKGMFIYSPILLLSVWGYCRFYCFFRLEALFFLGIMIVNLEMSALWHSFGGGWSWGPRLLVVTLPLWVLPFGMLLDTGRLRKWLLLVFACLSFFIQLEGVLQSDHEYHYIKYNQVRKIGEEMMKRMPPDIIGSGIILKHKIFQKNNVYRLSEFGIKSDTFIDTSHIATYQGFNLWYCYLARRFHQPALKFVPVVFLPLLVLVLRKLFFLASV